MKKVASAKAIDASLVFPDPPFLASPGTTGSVGRSIPKYSRIKHSPFLTL
ncbi:hypothetical protein CIPA99_00680 [Corynebacterium diphtheriae]|nr:hypothetical protein CIPA99_00680 [Corynebacterium diphtheriae]